MPTPSPLDTAELRQIEKTLDEGNTQEAASRLSVLGDSREHKEAIDFLTTRLLFQRGRIDLDGAADRLSAILQRVTYFPEAEDWLIELEARTERSALADLSPAREVGPGMTPAPPSQAPSIPRSHPEGIHPFFDELESDDVTPTESFGRLAQEDVDEGSPSSSEPPPRPAAMTGGDLMGSEPPTRPDLTRESLTAPAPAEAEPVTPTRPSHMPFDNLRAKEQLSAQAGRYRGGNDDPGEVVGLGRRSRRPPPGRPSQRPPPSLEACIRDAFALLDDGHDEQARALLPEGDSPEDLAPELRTLLARLFLELGQAERAAREAHLALEQAPRAVETQLVFVWSAVRYARQRDDAWSLERAGRILKELQDPTLAADLVDALASFIEARIGVPAVALRLAQRALRVNADSVDGLAALAEAAALCGEERRAEVALERLFAVSESAAEEIAPRLRRLGVGEHGPTSSASVWLPLEHTLSSGAREVALGGLEAFAEEALARLDPPLPANAEASARAAAELLALGPVFRHFGPYDFSLDSIERLEVGLGLLYGSGPRPLDVAGVSAALWQLAGLYLGETLRQCCEGQWREGQGREGFEPLKDATLELLGGDVQPFQIVRHRIAHGRRATLKAALDELLQAAPPSARAYRVAGSAAPVPPWGEGAWPDLDALPRLGRALGHSVVAAYASELLHIRLDRSGPSLAALDRYVQLVAPAAAPLDPASGWARWLCVFLGAYAGEVLCRELGGVWVQQAAEPPDAFAIDCGAQRLTPLSLVLAALSGSSTLRLADLLAAPGPTPAPPEA